MKISIVTISFNQKQYLKDCIDSILSQEDCDLEYIVVDPGSTDGSRELIESYGNRLIKVFEKDDGPADGLNKGFAHATGEIYGFINSDDYLLPGALKCITQFFANRPPETFMTGHGFTEDEIGRRTPVYPSVLTEKTMLHRAAVLFQQATFFNRALFVATGGFNPTNSTCWDYEIFLRFLQNGATHFVIGDSLATFRLYCESISGSGRLRNRYFQDLDRLFVRNFRRDRNFLDKLMTVYLRSKRKFAALMISAKSHL
jgi:glycosyltransferase involved in cell wall biosynthesis